MSPEAESGAAQLQEAARLRLRALDALPPRLRWVDATVSTNTDLLAAGLPHAECDVLAAESQSGGRGRLGRRWQSQPGGSLCLSFAMAWPGGPAAAVGASLVAGLAVAEALRSLGVAELGLKWPNDLWARDRKLGGLLVEFGGPAATPFLVVGLGLNLALSADFDAGQDWIDLAALGMRPDRVELVARVVLALRARLWQLQREGFDALRPDWQRLDLLQGRAVRMHAGDACWDGVALGLAADGGLRVQHAAGERVWRSGEASLRPA